MTDSDAIPGWIIEIEIGQTFSLPILGHVGTMQLRRPLMLAHLYDDHETNKEHQPTAIDEIITTIKSPVDLRTQ